MRPAPSGTTPSTPGRGQRAQSSSRTSSNFFKVYSPDGRALARDDGSMALTLRTGQEYRGEFTVERPDGRRLRVLTQVTPIRDEGGRLLGAANVMVDLTERVRAEEALRASEERFARFIRHLPGSAWMKDPHGRYVYTSEAVERLMGVPPGGLLGKTDHEIHPPPTAAQLRDHDRRASADDTGVRVTETVTDARGDARHYLVCKFPIRDAGGEVALVGGMAFEITEQLRAQEVLREQAELLDLATDAILIHDPAGTITYWNRGAERLYGWARDEALGRNADALLGTVFPRPREEIAAEVARIGHWEGDLTHTRRGGSSVVVASRWNRRLGDGGGLAAVLEINTDVTELRQAARSREQFVKRLIAAQEEERRRVARELHDGVAQTLSALHLRAGALGGRHDVPAPVRDELAGLRRMAQGAAEEVRFLARGLRPPALDELGLLPALTRYAEDFARAHGLRVEVAATGEGGGRLPAEVETALYRIAQEALANAARHGHAAAVSVILLRQPPFVQLLVEDDGAGWDPAARPADGYAQLGFQGMRERAALLGGTLTVESEPGGGAAVCARLPLGGGA